jgi:hypothetical protein
VVGWAIIITPLRGLMMGKIWMMFYKNITPSGLREIRGGWMGYNNNTPSGFDDGKDMDDVL